MASEAWLSGPVEGVSAYLQPAAHALQQAKMEVEEAAPALDPRLLWRRSGAASAGFHLLHLAGALDRLFTYARNEALNDGQKNAARAEAQDHPELDVSALVRITGVAIERAMAQLRATDPSTLLNPVKVGRAGLPSTVIGCLFHGAEHSARHAGQFLTTVKLLGGRSHDGSR
jgi:DinB family protein